MRSVGRSALALNAISERIQCGAAEILINRWAAASVSKGHLDCRLRSSCGGGFEAFGDRL